MTFNQICALFGGPSRVNKILGLKDSTARDVRRCVASNDPRKDWIKKLKLSVDSEIEELENRILELEKFRDGK